MGLLSRVPLVARIKTIATTNTFTAIDPALKDRPSRFDVVLETPPLDWRESLRYIRNWLDSRKMQRDGDLELLTEVGDLTGAQLQEICTSAVINALERVGDDESGSPLCISDVDLRESLSRVKGSRKLKAGFGEFA